MITPTAIMVAIDALALSVGGLWGLGFVQEKHSMPQPWPQQRTRRQQSMHGWLAWQAARSQQQHQQSAVSRSQFDSSTVRQFDVLNFAARGIRLV
jgi:hypothetical protein